MTSTQGLKKRTIFVSPLLREGKKECWDRFDVKINYKDEMSLCKQWKSASSLFFY